MARLVPLFLLLALAHPPRNFQTLIFSNSHLA
jgi:hypothetical protein